MADQNGNSVPDNDPSTEHDLVLQRDGTDIRREEANQSQVEDDDDPKSQTHKKKLSAEFGSQEGTVANNVGIQIAQIEEKNLGIRPPDYADGECEKTRLKHPTSKKAEKHTYQKDLYEN